MARNTVLGLLITLAAVVAVAAVIWLLSRCLGLVRARRGTRDGEGFWIILTSATVAHAAASYAAMLIVWGVEGARGTAAAGDVFDVLLAPVTLPTWALGVAALSSDGLGGFSGDQFARGVLRAGLYAAGFVVAYRLANAPLMRRLRRARGLCGCGYDLRGNVSGVCPECGGDDAGGRRPAGAGPQGMQAGRARPDVPPSRGAD